MLLKTAPVIAAALLWSALPASAATPGQLRQSPFGSLFTPPQIAPQPRPSPLPLPRRGPQPPAAGNDRPIGQPRIACGTKVVPVDPVFDAAIRKQAPTRPKPSARVVPTPPCK